MTSQLCKALCNCDISRPSNATALESPKLKHRRTAAAPTSTLHAPFLAAAWSPLAGQREQRVPVCTFVMSRVFLSLIPSNIRTAHDLFFNSRVLSLHYSRNCGPAYANKLSYQRSRMQFQREFPDILIGGCSCLNLYLQQSNVSLDWRSLSCGIPCDTRPGYTYCRDAPPGLLLQPLYAVFLWFCVPHFFSISLPTFHSSNPISCC
jgi:hypothetical protein